MKLSGRFGITVAAGVLSLGLLAGCSDDEGIAYVERPPEELYNTALDALAAEDFELATQNFEEVDRQHPYSIWATKAQLMAAYVYYLDDEYDEAVIALERFIDLHPGSPDAAYAYYLRAISYYEQIVDVGRDQKITRLALDSLQEVARRFPGTAYARDAELKIDLTLDHLAGKEMEIGRFYQNRGELLAAINRYKVVIEQFQTTTHVPEALHRVVESYLMLGITDEAQTAGAVLGYNYPGSEWYAESFALLEGRSLAQSEEGWFSSLWSWAF
ncbi:outer membrane protein assembly factor BamD [Hwanghaeella sp.]|uniref:outer membrane protein assembly factor BamD n=1 Tax=Hwanghaeella sp. TaxID=2605943 RepID=UPI003CCC1193